MDIETMKRRYWIIIILALVLVIGMVGLTSDSDKVPEHAWQIRSASDFTNYLNPPELLSKENYAELVKHDRYGQELIIDFVRPGGFAVLDDFDWKLNDIYGNTSGYKLYILYEDKYQFIDKDLLEEREEIIIREKEVQLAEARQIIKNNEYSKEDKFRFKIKPVWGACEKFPSGQFNSLCHRLTDAIPRLNSYWFTEYAYFEDNSSQFQGTFTNTRSDGVNLTLNYTSGTRHWGVGKDQVGYWQFETNGSAEDSSGMYNNGSVDGATYTSEGKVEGGYIFDGDDTITIPKNVSLKFGEKNFTVAGWIKFDGSGYMRILGTRFGAVTNAWNLYVNGGQLSFQLSSPHVAATTVDRFYDDEWHFFTLIRRAANISIYVDGEHQKTTTTGTVYNVTNENDFLIGENLDVHFTGSLDEIILYNRSLTADKIKEIYDFIQINYSKRGSFLSDPICTSGAFEKANWLNLTYSFVKTANQNVTVQACFSNDNSTFVCGGNLTTETTDLNSSTACFKYDVNEYTDNINVTPYFTNIKGNYDFLPATPNILGPADAAVVVLPVQLNISNSSDVESSSFTYQFWNVSSDGTLLSLEYDGPSTNFSWDPAGDWTSPPPNNGVWYWRARAFDGISYSELTATRSFSLNTTFLVNASNPYNGEFQEINVTLVSGTTTLFNSSTNNVTSFSLNKNKRYNVTISRPGYINRTYFGYDPSVDLAAEIWQYQLTLLVSDAIHGNVVSSFKVSLPGNYVNGSSGVAILRLPNGTFEANITAAGYDSYRFNISTTLLANETQSIDMSPYVQIIVLDESDGAAFDVAGTNNTKIRMICSTDTLEFEFNKTNNTLYVPVSCPWDLLKLDVVYGSSSYFRALMPDYTDRNVTFYALDLNEVLVYQIVLKLNDLTGEYDAGRALMKKYIGSEEVIIQELLFDVEDKAVFYLLKDGLYTLSIKSTTGLERTLGYFLADSAGEKTITVPAIDFVPTGSIGVNLTWTWQKNDTLIKLIYNDTTVDGTSNLTFSVYNVTGANQSVLLYRTSSYDISLATFSFGLNVNTSYSACFVATHSTLGILKNCKTYLMDFSMGFWDGFGEEASVIKNWISILLVLVGILLFRTNMTLGLGFGSIMMVVFIKWEWLSFGSDWINYTILSLAVIMTVLTYFIEGGKT